MGTASLDPKGYKFQTIISEKNRDSNRQNAQHSTGTKSPEGKAAVHFNALTYGLRTRATILERDNPADYSQFWDELEADWQPQTRTERCYLETSVTSQWLLKRVAESESLICEAIKFGEERFKMSDMKQSQTERRQQNARQPQPAQTVPSPQPPAPASATRPRLRPPIM